MESKNVDAQRNRAFKIASEKSLPYNTTKRFVDFVIEWGKIRNKDFSTDIPYIYKWAERFKKGTEHADASGDAMVALVNVTGKELSLQLLTKTLDEYNGFKPSHREEAKERIEFAFKSCNLPSPFKNNSMKGYKNNVPHKCKCKKQFADLENAYKRML